MKMRIIFGAALLGLGLNSSAFAQTTMPATGGVPSAAGAPTTPAAGAIAPGQPGTVTGTLPAGSAAPAGGVLPLGTSPATGTLGTGTLRADQPAGVTTPTTPATRSAQRGRRTTTPGSTQNQVRP